MKANFVTMVISGFAWAIALWGLMNGLADATAHTRYYVWAVFTISGILAVVTLVRQLLRFRNNHESTSTLVRQPSNRDRLHYRLAFDETTGPLFVQKIDESLSAAAFRCPVKDVSETGLGLACSGIFNPGEIVHGEIIFPSGRTAPVNGTVIRLDENLTSLKLHCTIDPSLLMAEQREQIVLTKGENGRPPRHLSNVEMPTGSLPSHRPKGICRIK